MSTRRVELLDDEEIVLEGGTGVLTNQRLLANWKPGNNPEALDEVLLRDITGFKRVIGGQEDRAKQGLAIGAVGAVFMIIDILYGTSLSETIDMVLFLIGALGILIGAYLVLRSYARIKPHTTILFQVNGRRDIPVIFPGRNNPEADEFAHRYTRTRRGL